MQIELKMDPSCTEPKIVIYTACVTDEVSALLRRLSEDAPQIISGTRNDRVEVLDQAELIRVYANAGKVFAVTDKGEYTLRLRLYELEKRLDTCRFARYFGIFFLIFILIWIIEFMISKCAVKKMNENLCHRKKNDL